MFEVLQTFIDESAEPIRISLVGLGPTPLVWSVGGGATKVLPSAGSRHPALAPN